MPEAELAFLFIRPLREIRARFIVTGSIAAIVYGEPRLTHDLDLLIFLTREQIDRLPEIFPSEQFYCPPPEVILFEAGREHRGHLNLIHIQTGFKADLYFEGNDPLHHWAFAKALTLRFMGEEVRVAPPEYVILRKLEFFREGGSEKHLRDIRMMLKNSGERMNLQKLSELVAERGLQPVWERAQSNTNGSGR